MIHGARRSSRWDYDHHVVPPMTSSSTFRLETVERGARGFAEFAHGEDVGARHRPIYIYDRLEEPTGAMLEENLALAESGDMALCFSSGMAAIAAAMHVLVRGGERIVAHEVLYGCTYSLFTDWLPRCGIRVELVDLTDPQALRRALTPQTRVVYFETPVNPDLTLIDIRAVCDEVARLNRERDPAVRVVVDNTFAGPFCQRPLELGADVVCASLSKSIGGFGTDIGGAVIGPQWLHDGLILYRKDYGGCLSPKAAWDILVYGLPSLAARMVNYQKSAMHVAEFLHQHPQVVSVRYPGLPDFPQHDLARSQMRDSSGRFAPGSMLYFELADPAGDGAPARRLVDWIARHSYCITLAVSLGQVKTLIECPYHMTHAALPASAKRHSHLAPGGCRLSVGLEDWHDIIADLEAGLKRI
jgi:cystathionine beta-lyase/cystathionine gamma-synthase